MPAVHPDFCSLCSLCSQIPSLEKFCTAFFADLGRVHGRRSSLFLQFVQFVQLDSLVEKFLQRRF